MTGARPVAAAVVAAVLAMAACSRDGRELAAPTPDQTTTTATTAAAPGTALALTSPAFAEGAALPEWTGCPSDVSPPLQWSGVPAGTVELALVVTDEDAGGYVHWVVAGIDPAATGVGQGAAPPGAVQATNDAGGVGWTGPCPPPGETHTYVFRLLAFGAPIGLAEGVEGRRAVELLTGAAAEAQLRGTFARA